MSGKPIKTSKPMTKQINPPTYPNEKARFDTFPWRSLGATSTRNALLKTIDSSVATKAAPKSQRASVTSPSTGK